MTLKYKLQEGFIDVRVRPKDVVTGDQSYVILFPSEVAKVTTFETDKGSVLMDHENETTLDIDSDFLQMFGVSEETIVNLNVSAALQALAV